MSSGAALQNKLTLLYFSLYLLYTMYNIDKTMANLLGKQFSSFYKAYGWRWKKGKKKLWTRTLAWSLTELKIWNQQCPKSNIYVCGLYIMCLCTNTYSPAEFIQVIEFEMTVSNMLTSEFKWNIKKQIMHSRHSTCCPEGSGKVKWHRTPKFPDSCFNLEIIRLNSSAQEVVDDDDMKSTPSISFHPLGKLHWNNWQQNIYSNICILTYVAYIQRWDSRKSMLKFKRQMDLRLFIYACLTILTFPNKDTGWCLPHQVERWVFSNFSNAANAISSYQWVVLSLCEVMQSQRGRKWGRIMHKDVGICPRAYFFWKSRWFMPIVFITILSSIRIVLSHCDLAVQLFRKWEAEENILHLLFSLVYTDIYTHFYFYIHTQWVRV